MIARRAADLVGHAARCVSCRETVGEDDIDERGGREPMSACCDALVYIVDRDTPTLVAERGPAWASFVAAPRALLSARFAYDDHGERREINASSKLLAIELLDWLHLPEVYPSCETLAKRAGMSERTARRALAELERAGLLARSRRHGRTGARLPDLLDLAPLVKAINGLAATLAVAPNGHPGRWDVPDVFARTSGEPSGQPVHGLAANLAATPPDKLAGELEGRLGTTQADVDEASARSADGADDDPSMWGIDSVDVPTTVRR